MPVATHLGSGLSTIGFDTAETGDIRVGVKNTFVEVAPPSPEPIQRSLTLPAGAMGSMTPHGGETPASRGVCSFFGQSPTAAYYEGGASCSGRPGNNSFHFETDATSCTWKSPTKGGLLGPSPMSRFYEGIDEERDPFSMGPGDSDVAAPAAAAIWPQQQSLDFGGLQQQELSTTGQVPMMIPSEEQIAAMSTTGQVPMMIWAVPMPCEWGYNFTTPPNPSTCVSQGVSQVEQHALKSSTTHNIPVPPRNCKSTPEHLEHYLSLTAQVSRQALAEKKRIREEATRQGARGDPRRLAQNEAFSKSIITQLQGGQADERTAILKWLCPAALELAMSTCGCRVMQTALEVAGGGDRAAFVGQFLGHVILMLESPNANHVLQKYIEVMPPAAVQVVMDELASYPGGWEALACHKFGCRVEQRLMEHCSEELTDPMTTAIAIRADMLCQHPMGNYVIQHVLSCCSLTRRSQVAFSLIQGGGVGLMELAQNRMASNVLERALELCGSESQQALATAILSARPALLEIGCSRYGVYVVRRMLEVLRGPLRDELLFQLVEGTPQLHGSKFGRGLVELARLESARF